MSFEFNPLKQGRNPAAAFIPDNPHTKVYLGAPPHEESIKGKVLQTCTKTRIFEGGRFMSEETEFKTSKSIQAFMPVGGGIKVQLRPPGPAPILGKPFVGPASIMGQKPLKLPNLKPMVAESPQPILLTERQEPLPPAPAPKLEDPQVRISVERIVFLERLEKLMGDDTKMKELEAENRALIRAIARLQEELDILKAKPSEKVTS